MPLYKLVHRSLDLVKENLFKLEKDIQAIAETNLNSLIDTSDREWIIEMLGDHWGSPVVVSRGRVYLADQLPGLVAIGGGQNLGLVTYSINGTECEIVTLNSIQEGQGIGSALLNAVESIARRAGCTRCA